MLGDVRALGLGLGLGQVRSEFRVQMDLASVSGLHQLIFCVWDLVLSGGQVARSDSKTSGEARGQQVRRGQISQQCYLITKLIYFLVLGGLLYKLAVYSASQNCMDHWGPHVP